MAIRRTAITLANRQAILTEVADSAYLVNTGFVDVYIVPQGGRQSERRMQVCRVGQGDVVPAFCYRDADYQRWAFALVASGPVELTEMGHAVTDPLRTGFLMRAGLADEVGQGFDDCLVNRYRRIQAMEHGYFVRADRDVRETARQTRDLLTASPSKLGDDRGMPDEAQSRLPLDVVGAIPKGRIAGMAFLSSAFAWAAMIAAASARHAIDGSAFIGSGNADIPLAGAAFASVLVVLCLAFAKGVLLGNTRVRAQADAFSSVVRHLFELPESYLNRYERTQLTLLAGEAKRVAGGSIDALDSIVSGLVGLVLLGLQMSWYSVSLFAATLAVGCALGGVTYALSVRKRRYDGLAQSIESHADSMLGQFLDGMEKVRVAGIEHRATHEYLKHYVRRCSAEAGSHNARHMASLLFWYAMQAVILLVLVLGWQSGMSDAGTMLACAILALALVGACRAVALGVGRFAALRRSSCRVGELLDQAIEEQRGGGEVASLQGAIDFEDVSFSYEGESSPALSNISLHISPGESVGIIGRSGCGKSTLLALILGLQTPTSGTVRFDGLDAASLDVRSLRRCIGTVLQDDALIAGSIYENVAFTAPGASVADVRCVLEAVGLWKEVSRMPMGVATIVGEGGCALSGGQVQRILLARALVGNPQILLLDEATSALDGASQEAVRNTLIGLNCTKVIIAHRLDALADCDRIIVMDAGCIVREVEGAEGVVSW